MLIIVMFVMFSLIYNTYLNNVYVCVCVCVCVCVQIFCYTEEYVYMFSIFYYQKLPLKKKNKKSAKYTLFSQ